MIMSEPAIAVIDMVRAIPKASGFNQRSYAQANAMRSTTNEEQRMAEAFAAGFDEGHGVASLAARADKDALLAIIAKAEALQAEPSDELAALIAETVFGLVEGIVSTVQIDREMLQKRIDAAVAIISDCNSARSIFLHPDDLVHMTGLDLPVALVADADMARGDVRIDCSQGWIEHGTSVFLDRLRSALGITATRPNL
jgi:flagellar assembly protein FliH